MKFLVLLATIPVALAHFTLDFPSTTGFSEDTEFNSPCGGFNPSSNNLMAWPLSGGQIAIDSHHPMMTILYRAQLQGSSSWVNLTNGFVQMTGLGELCITALAVPGNWSGKAGVIQVIGQPPDGILYQCAGVNFTDGAPGSGLCVNGTGITLAPTATGFSISSDTITFGTGSGTGASGSPIASATGTATSKPSSGTKDYVVQFSMLAFLAALCFIVVGI